MKKKAILASIIGALLVMSLVFIGFWTLLNPKVKEINVNYFPPNSNTKSLIPQINENLNDILTQNSISIILDDENPFISNYSIVDTTVNYTLYNFTTDGIPNEYFITHMNISQYVHTVFEGKNSYSIDIYSYANQSWNNCQIMYDFENETMHEYLGYNETTQEESYEETEMNFPNYHLNSGYCIDICIQSDHKVSSLDIAASQKWIYEEYTNICIISDENLNFSDIWIFQTVHIIEL